MALQVITSYVISYNGNSTNYLSSPKHRGQPTNDISVWTVDVETELSCFRNCYQNKWHNGSNGWSFMVAGISELLRLGYNLRSPQLIIAKFVENQNLWHGYPADIRHKPSDKPIPQILADWFKNGHISKSLMTRIKQGQL